MIKGVRLFFYMQKNAPSCEGAEKNEYYCSKIPRRGMEKMMEPVTLRTS